FCCGRAQLFCSAQTMASRGLVMQITKESGAYFFIPEPTWPITFRLMSSKSSRLMPGLRGTPAVTMQTSAPPIAAYLLVPINFASKPLIGDDCAISRALPWGMPSITSNSTTSPSSFNPMRWASVPPIWPAPINAILLRAMVGKLSTCAAAERGRVVVNRLDLARQEAETREGSVAAIVYTLYQQTKRCESRGKWRQRRGRGQKGAGSGFDDLGYLDVGALSRAMRKAEI